MKFYITQQQKSKALDALHRAYQSYQHEKKSYAQGDDPSLRETISEHFKKLGDTVMVQKMKDEIKNPSGESQ